MGLRGGGDRVVIGVAVGLLVLLAALAALAGLGALVLWALASPAEAQAACGGRSEMVRRLAQGFGEVQVGSGLSGERIVEVWAAPDGGTWTILVTTPGGISCLAAAGEGWVAAPDVPVGEPM